MIERHAARRARPRQRPRFVVDATGPRGFLGRVLGLDGGGFDGYPGTQALYSHFTGVARCADMPEFATRSGAPPYPIDAAALHHVFDGGWMWVLRFDNGVTSAGVAVTDALAAELRLADGEPAWHRLLARYPSVAAQFAEARPIRGFTWMPRLAWRAASASGERWAMLPSAAAFIDPLFSTGIPLTLLGVERLARSIGGPGGHSVLRRHAGRGRPRRAIHRRLLRRLPALRRFRRLVDVLLRGGQLQRDVAAAARRHLVARIPACATTRRWSAR